MHDLNDMTVFARVVERGGISAAARLSGLPKSNVSRRVARLEEQLGVRLLERTTRRQRLTEIGEVYYRHCRRILEEVEQADLSVGRLREAPGGLLRVSASVTVGQHLLGPLIAGFMARHKQVRVQLVLSNRRVDVIEEGFDLVIRIGPLEDSSLVARRLGSGRGVLYAGPDYLRARGIPDGPDDLAGHDCLVMREFEAPDRWRLIGPAGTRTIAVQPRAIINDLTTLKQVVADGGGIAFLPGYICADDERRGRVVRVLPGWSLESSDFHALYPSHRGATPKVRAFLDYLIESIGARLREDTAAEAGERHR